MSIARLQSDGQFRVDLDAAHTRADVLGAVDTFIRRSAVVPTAPTRPDGLDASGFAGGLRDDLARRWPHYANDFADGLNLKSLAASLFLFFAQVAPTVAFGGLMAQLTGHEIGVMEMIVAVAVGGIV